MSSGINMILPWLSGFETTPAQLALSVQFQQPVSLSPAG